MRLAIVTTHPIQYYAPLFRLLSGRQHIAVKVFYTWEKDAAAYDKDFGKEVKWDIPLLEGYEYQFVSNNGSIRKDFRGVKNPGLIREIEKWGADAILVFGWNYYSHLKAMRYFKNRKLVLFRGDSTLLGERPGFKRIARRLFLRWVYSYVDIAFYVGTNNKNYFLAHGLREDQLQFAPHAIDNDRFYDKDGKYEEEAKKWRKELGIDENDLILTFVGKFQDTKDPFLLMEAFLQLNNPKCHLLFVGNGELEHSLKDATKENDHIHFLPFQNQSRMPVIYRIGDAFCLPSKGETWGLAANEAMACSRAVLLSDRCGCAVDLVIDGKNGLIFASGNKEDLINKMTDLLSRGPALKISGSASAEIIGSWSYQQICSALEKVNLTKYA